MARIIKEGQSHPNKPWVGYEATCQHCTCEFELDEDDDVKPYLSPKNENFFATFCPGCRNLIYIDESVIRYRRPNQS